MAQNLARWRLRRPGVAAGRVVRRSGGAADKAPPPRLPLAPYASVVIPALNEARRIADVVAHALADRATAEVIVIDDSSIDDTVALARAAGAGVVTSTMLGKGRSMDDGLVGDTTWWSIWTVTWRDCATASSPTCVRRCFAARPTS
ncbi:MAG TPA: glycosyltransferase [Rubrivivax sp.]